MNKKLSNSKESSKEKGDPMEQYWLHPSASALARLEEIQSSVTSMQPASTIDVQAVWHPARSTPPPPPDHSPPHGNDLSTQASSHRGRPARPRSARAQLVSSYTDLETRPPLSTLTTQETAWGSSSSIPALIKAQGERQKQGGRGGVARPARPWSGRKATPTPSPSAGRGKQQAGRDAVSDSAAFIAVTGSRSVMYVPGSRPSSGRSHPPSQASVPSTASCDVIDVMAAANSDMQQMSEERDNALEEFLRNQPNGHRHELSKLSAAYASERLISPPPPPPCASPDLEKLISGGLFEEDDADNHHDDQDQGRNETSAAPPPQLLRRPTPEPLRLSMHVPGADEEQDYSTDEDGSSAAASPILSPDIDVQSVTSEVSGDLFHQSGDIHQSGDLHHHLSSLGVLSPNHSGIRGDSIAPHGLGPASVASKAHDSESEDADRNESKSHLSVHFVDEKNVTFDITPRNSISLARPHPPPASPGSRNGTRPRSALKTSRHSHLQSHGARPGSSQESGRRPKSAGASGSRESRQTGVSKRTVNRTNSHDSRNIDDIDSDSQKIRDDIMDAMNNNRLEQSIRNNEAMRRKRNEVETMMSRLGISDDGDDLANSGVVQKPTPEASHTDVTRTVQVSSSSSKKNYYEKAIQEKKRSMYQSQRQQAETRTMTTKVIEFGEEGPSMETSGVSFIQVVPPPSQVRGARPPSSRGHRQGWEEDGASHTQLNRATMDKKTVVERTSRPTSRMGLYHDMDEGIGTGESHATNTTKAMQRAKPRSAVLKAKPEVTGHDCSKKSPRKTKQRPHSSYVRTTHRKKSPVRRASSPSAQSHSNSNKALVPTVKKSQSELQRTRDAVKALRDGSLKDVKKYDKRVVPLDDGTGGGRVLRASNRQEESQDSDEDSIDEYPKSVKEEEIFNLHRRLTRSGIKVSYKTLKKGLVAPDEKNVDQCCEQLPSNYSLNLLNKPEVWLGETYQKYRMADNALKRVERELAVQEAKKEREAQRLKEAMQPGARTKRKKKKTSAKRKTKPPSSAASRSAPPSAKSRTSVGGAARPMTADGTGRTLGEGGVARLLAEGGVARLLAEPGVESSPILQGTL